MEVITIDPMINGIIKIKILVATFVLIQIQIALEILNRFLNGHLFNYYCLIKSNM